MTPRDEIEAERNAAEHKAWLQWVNTKGDVHAGLYDVFVAGYRSALSPAAPATEAKCPRCHGARLDPVQPNAMWPYEACHACCGEVAVKRAADGETPAALKHPGLLGQSPLWSEKPTTTPTPRAGASEGEPAAWGIRRDLPISGKGRFVAISNERPDPSRVDDQESIVPLYARPTPPPAEGVVERARRLFCDAAFMAIFVRSEYGADAVNGMNAPPQVMEMYLALLAAERGGKGE